LIFENTLGGAGVVEVVVSFVVLEDDSLAVVVPPLTVVFNVEAEPLEPVESNAEDVVEFTSGKFEDSMLPDEDAEMDEVEPKLASVETSATAEDSEDPETSDEV
jgi:hypothetical protein